MKRVLRVIGIALAILLLAAVSLPFLVSANRFRPALETQLTKALGRKVQVGDLKLSLFSGGVTASNLAVADDPAFARNPFLEASSLKLGVELWPLIFSRKLNVTGLTIDRPQIVLLQSPDGTWNFSSLGGSRPSQPPAAAPPSRAPGFDLSVKLVKITDGRLSLGKLKSREKPQVLENVDAELRDFTAASAFPFALSAKVAGGGTIRLSGTAGPIDHSDTARTPAQAKLQVERLDLLRTGFLSPATGMAGLVSFDGSGVSNGRTVQLTGRLKAEGLKLARNGTPARQPVEFEFAVRHEVEKHSGTLSRGDLHIGDAVAHLTGTYVERGESTVVNMNLAGPRMPVPQLAAMLPSMGIVLPKGSSLQNGTASATLNVQGPTDHLVTSGSVGLDNTRLAGFDLGSKLSAVAQLAGVRAGPDTDIQKLAANLRMAPDGTAIDGLTLIVPAIGELGGGGTISPAQNLDFKMRAVLHTSGGIMTALGRKADTSVPFLVLGTASDPVFRPDMRAIAERQVKTLDKALGQSQAGKAAGSLIRGLLGGAKKQQ